MQYYLTIEDELKRNDVDAIFARVFRKNYSEPGFIVLFFGRNMNSTLLRQRMVKIKQRLSEKCATVFSEKLDYYWLGRFDQQTTTKYHRDNAPEDSYLMLGYEPTAIGSNLSYADYHKFVSDNDIEPQSYYELHNPMFTSGEVSLEPYIKHIANFDKGAYKIVLMNNSDLSSKKSFGVLHKAEIVEQDLNEPRVINSMMLYLTPTSQPDSKSEAEVNEFVETDSVSR